MKRFTAKLNFFFSEARMLWLKLFTEETFVTFKKPFDCMSKFIKFCYVLNIMNRVNALICHPVRMYI